MPIARQSEVRIPVMEENGERIYELLGAANGELRNHSIIKLELEPGAVSPARPHYHKQAEETYVILSGVGEITIGDGVDRVAAGDIATALIGEKHQIRAVGSEPLVALAIMAPGFNPDDVFE